MSTTNVLTGERTTGLIKGALNLSSYHKIMNDLYEEVLGEHGMVHFPYYGSRTDSLIDGQVNLTEACLRYFPALEGQRVLEVGCGNGVQSMYVLTHHDPSWVTGLDFNGENVKLAQHIARNRGLQRINFVDSDAQNMSVIPDNHYNCVLNVESAFHYPDKDAFFREIYRVLKPGGSFVIADILMKPNNRHVVFRHWERRLSQHYWHLDRYRTSLAAAGLVIRDEEDITEPVLKGFATSKHWMRNAWFKDPLRKALVMTFMRLQIARHVHYLTHNCTYNIFAGYKPEL